MLFKNPEFLYLLFLLIIPILIHLFQLRKFKKTAFTNVALLKALRIQSRKSSQIKKWLILILRLLALAALVFAFAQPYISASNEATKQSVYTVYLDNSFSMQMPTKRENLLKDAQQQLVKLIPEDAKIHFFTNNSNFKNLNSKEFKKEVLNTTFTNQQFNFENALLKAKQLNNEVNKTQKIIFVSDFQQQENVNFVSLAEDESITFIQVTPEPITNFAITNLNYNETEKLLSIQIDASENTTNQIPLSVFDSEKLLAKQQVSFQNSNSIILDISIENDFLPYGKVEIKDEALQYDNQFYFSINISPKIDVLCIYEGKSSFLKRIFNSKEFNYKETAFSSLDYAVFNDQNLIILNQIKNISSQLQSSIQKFADEGGTVVIIPSNEADVTSYNTTLSNLKLPNYTSFSQNQQKITTINFNHPLLKNVFSKEVKNFEYPLLKSHYSIKTPNNAILKLANQESFLVSKKPHYLFAGELAETNSNFTTSPLIVPVFYNMGRNSVLKQNIFDFNHQINEYIIEVDLDNDNIIELVKGDKKIIPQQQKWSKKVKINTAELDLDAGTYVAKANQEYLKYISFNHTRQQSNLNYFNVKEAKNKEINTIEEFFSKEAQINQIDEYWKALLIFAFVLLLFEMLALRFIK